MGDMNQSTRHAVDTGPTRKRPADFLIISGSSGGVEDDVPPTPTTEESSLEGSPAKMVDGHPAVGRRKRYKSKIPHEHAQILEAAFQENHNVKGEELVLLAKRLDLNQRTVQVWFQNRRAKLRKIEGHQVKPRRRHLEKALAHPCSGSSGTTIPDGIFYPAYLGNSSSPNAYGDVHELASLRGPIGDEQMSDFTGYQEYPNVASASHTGGAGHWADYTSLPPEVLTPTGSVNWKEPPFPFTPQAAVTTTCPAESTKAPCVPLQTLPMSVEQIQIGSWQRFALSRTADLLVEVDLVQNALRATFIEGNARCRLKLPLETIIGVAYASADYNPNIGEITIDILEPPQFEMFTGEGEWTACSDFTEDAQASVCFTHVLHGPFTDLRAEMLALTEQSLMIRQAMMRANLRMQRTMEALIAGPRYLHNGYPSLGDGHSDATSCVFSPVSPMAATPETGRASLFSPSARSLDNAFPTAYYTPVRSARDGALTMHQA
ncbi:uncharacterized protein EV422DRAFT_364093 [Fimicolochytrium jonesii]|uniref:uncharacterized protein n=1 Tax=Fimicolochytrium jonesii TaxID=1396493 RepID=UPI0022FE1746|nr:uncharacterized protein EV422DRAFT_364093 [Fimicolochytrium jonesii]KAI8823643.1 hypothetical protein EV422DRAFT_364093 [Fimicolochytrium jonesii]